MLLPGDCNEHGPLHAQAQSCPAPRPHSIPRVLFTNDLLFLLSGAPPSHLFQNIVFHCFQIFAICKLSISLSCVLPPSFSYLSWANFKKDQSTLDVFISSISVLNLLYLIFTITQLQNFSPNMDNDICIGQIKQLVFWGFFSIFMAFDTIFLDNLEKDNTILIFLPFAFMFSFSHQYLLTDIP